MTTKTRTLIIAAVVILALAVAAFIYFTPPASAPGTEVVPENNIENGEEANVPEPTTNEPEPTPASNDITMAQVATHSSANDCWTVISGSVYNLTDWISQHPGGQQAILQLCGKDGTAQFTGQHGGSAPQEDTLATFKIGVLAQ